MTNFDRVSNWLKDSGQKPEHFNAQLAADIEEIREYMQSLADILSGVKSSNRFRLVTSSLKAAESLNNLKDIIKNTDGIELMGTLQNAHASHKKEFLDAICDREVTANGLCYMLGFDKNLADQLVQDSNDSKLLVDDDGNRYAKRNESGKIIKPESFIPVDLSDCIGG